MPDIDAIYFDLQIDYNYLESSRCLCGKPKQIGDRLCRACLEFLPAHDLQDLERIRAGDGVVDCAQRLRGRIDRARKTFR